LARHPTKHPGKSVSPSVDYLWNQTYGTRGPPLQHLLPPGL